jgi:hypothetical protein
MVLAAGSMLHAWIGQDDDRRRRKGGIGILAGRVILGRMMKRLFIRAMGSRNVCMLLSAIRVLPLNDMFPFILRIFRLSCRFFTLGRVSKFAVFWRMSL